jgi:hypothetical protein
MPTLNYTTTIASAKTIGELHAALVGAGADTISTTYDDGRPCGLSFVLATPHGDREFDLPVDIDAVHQLLATQKRKTRNSRIVTTRDQAERVAWRVLKDWLLAQLAMIEAQMVELDQVMLPYLRVNGEHSLYAAYKANEAQALEAGR